MTVNTPLPSAKIYQFPVGGRSGVPEYRADSKPASYETQPKVAITGWYHEAAIEEARRGTEH